jgi:hypothetical protein
MSRRHPTPAEHEQMRDAYAEGATLREVAARFGTDEGTVRRTVWAAGLHRDSAQSRRLSRLLERDKERGRR